MSSVAVLKGDFTNFTGGKKVDFNMENLMGEASKTLRTPTFIF